MVFGINLICFRQFLKIYLAIQLPTTSYPDEIIKYEA